MKLKGKAGIILLVVAGTGMVISLVLTAKSAPEAQKKKEEALQAKREATGNPNATLTFTESVKAQASCYTPVILPALTTFGSIVGAGIIDQKVINDISKLHTTYKEVNAKMNGVEAEKVISEVTEQKLKKEEAFTGKRTFVLDFLGKPIEFESTLEKVMDAEYQVNRYFKRKDGLNTITFNEFLTMLGVPEVDTGDKIGWNEYLGEAYYGYSWIDFVHRDGKYGNKEVTYIYTPFECHPLNEEEVKAEIEAALHPTE